jgi:hypothetical protein
LHVGEGRAGTVEEKIKTKLQQRKGLENLENSLI